MSDVVNWQGYLIKSQANNHLICSPWILDDSCVFGHDSDYTTLATSLLRYLSIDFKVTTLSNVDEKISQEILLASTDFVTGDEGFTITCNEDASLYIHLNNYNSIELPTEHMSIIDSDVYHKITNAWQEETNVKNISQGAYVSSQQYNQNLNSRLSLVAQDNGQLIWPQRLMDAQGNDIQDSKVRMKPFGKVITWTQLSAAGAPSEFAIRAPILGGICTVMIETLDGPNGVFLLVDDQNLTPEIGDSVELVVRRLYAQEGVIRYGAKAIISDL
ncbi:MAG TPA: hypothetical protein HA359_00915 [Candidatus Poseidoniaceae archaeon]|nr:MAG TPA: hypothetical protein D7H84_00920 [Candidatus Poseidoniales archaeon]DAC58897.1 MAG TPA: hypothetical protein D7I03_04925 [Candidatus Poseidoniales archaeon]HII22799.1 hypothetical protein [Candidatus Poseidoniaceae archaeon]HII50664.1 hypothetical protein [Candidatus Poseidoniaceae archaeon]|tara:strand:- start:58 stop:876 length:819 start_codon:yes stop_codon:yes gene_type:complete